MIEVFIILALMWLSGLAISRIGNKFAPEAKVKREMLDLLVRSPYVKMAFTIAGTATLEELIFRLGIIGGGLVLFPGAVIPLVVISASIFAFVHIFNLRSDDGVMRLFVLHCFTGTGLALIFLLHGFWIVLAAHFAYNLVLITGMRIYYRWKPEKLAKAYA